MHGYALRREKEVRKEGDDGRSLLLWRDAAPPTIHHTPRYTAIPTHHTPPIRTCNAVCCCMLRLGSSGQPPATCDAFCIDESVQYILGDDKQVFDGSEA